MSTSRLRYQEPKAGMSMEELKRLTSIRVHTNNNSMSHIHDSLNDINTRRGAVPMQHYSNTQKKTDMPAHAKQGENSARMSVDTLKQMTSLRLSVAATNGFPNSTNRTPNHATINPHTQTNSMGSSPTGPQLQTQSSLPVFKGSDLTPSENSVRMRSTVRQMGAALQRRLSFGGGNTLISPDPSTKNLDSETNTVSTANNTPESSFSISRDKQKPLTVINADDNIFGGPAPIDQLLVTPDGMSDSDDEDSIEALLAEATNLSAFNFSDSNENSFVDFGPDSHLDFDHSLIDDHLRYINNNPVFAAPRNPNMIDRLFGYSH